MNKLLFHRCSNCDAPLKVEAGFENAICQYCLTPFRIDKGITLEAENDINADDIINVLKKVPGSEEKGYVTYDYVNLRDCKIDDSTLELIGKLKSVESLTLMNTALTDKGLSYIHNLPRLKKLWLNQTKITDEGLFYLSQLTALEELNLSFTAVSDAGMDHLQSLKALEEIRLEWTSVTDKGLIKLLILPKLEEVIINMENVNVAALLKAGGIKFFRKETRIDIDEQGLDDSTIGFLKECKRAKILILNGNNIVGPGLSCLKDLGHLTRIWIERNPLDESSVEHFLNLNRLKELNIMETNIPPEGIEKIKKAFPRARLFTDIGEFL